MRERKAPWALLGDDQMTQGLNVVTAFPFQGQSVARSLFPLQGVPELVALISLDSKGFIMGTELSCLVQPPGVTCPGDGAQEGLCY